MGDGGGGTTTTSTKVELPQWYENYARGIADRAYTESQKTFPDYAGTRVAPMNADQLAAIDATRAIANGPSSVGAANSQLIDTINGKYLDPTSNPAWAPGVQSIIEKYQTGIAPSTNAAFSKAGAFGTDNSAFNEYKALEDRQLADSIGNLWGGLYNNERSRQIQSSGMAPLVEQGLLTMPQALLSAGGLQQAQAQTEADTAYSDFWAKQNYPWQQISNWANLGPALLGNQGTTVATGPNPNQGSKLAGAAGGASTAAALALAAGASGGVLLPVIAGGALLGSMM